MEFEQYVAARRVPLVRAAVLLGADPARAADLVDRTLTRCAARIGRSADPDPLVHAALLAALPEEPAPPPDGDEPGHDVRRSLAALDPRRRAVAVLAFHADLTPHETADALGVPASEVSGLEGEVRRSLEAYDGLRARELMMRAADSVEVPLLAPLPRPARRKRWPVVAGAAAGVAALALATALFGGGGSAEPPGGLDEDQVPSLFGFQVGEATTLLSSRGLEVEQQMGPSCDPPGTVIGTDPPTGTRVEEGDTVAVVSAFPSGYSCMAKFLDRTRAWEFLDFAAGRGQAPPFAPTVDVVVDGSEPVTLTAREAADPERWGDASVLTEVAAALSEVYDVPGSAVYRTPQLSAATTRPPRVSCGVPRPPSTGRRQALSLSVGVRGADYRCPLVVDLYRRHGAIDAVVLYTAKSPGGP